jgi:hypothetical protein
MTNKKYYDNYYQEHIWYNTNVNYRKCYKVINNNFWKLFNSKNISILDIWCGQWKFAYFCKQKWVKNYIWIDLDNSIITQNKKNFNYDGYKFININVFEFLRNNKNKYDIIYVSSVFEHFDLENAFKLAELIYFKLNEWWYWLNIMPNANFIACSYFRYGDITHKIIYNDNSFNQILLNVWFKKENITHKNQRFHFNIILNSIIIFYWWCIHRLVWLPKNVITPDLYSIIKR